MRAEQIARVCHEANRAYCLNLGDDSQPRWEDAPQWQIESAIAGVQALRQQPYLSPEDMHERWCALKRENGWRYGEVKDPDEKTHPCLVPYSQLPPSQRCKDALFSAIVKALL